MADISSIILPNGNSYNFKDSTARTTAASVPSASNYLVVETKTVDNITIEGASTASAEFSISKTGYTVLGVVGLDIEDATASGKNCHICRTYGVYAGTSSAYVRMRNGWPSGMLTAKVKVIIKILYKKNS